VLNPECYPTGRLLWSQKEATVPKFTITAEFCLRSEIEVDLSPTAFDSGNVPYDEYEDSSYFQTVSVESTGGSITFVVEADGEDEAREMAEEVIRDGQEVEDRNDLTWLIDSVEIEVEEIEEEMTKEKAIALVSEFLRNSSIPEDVKDAIRFLIVTLAS
jgi:hypothetical protein